MAVNNNAASPEPEKDDITQIDDPQQYTQVRRLRDLFDAKQLAKRAIVETPYQQATAQLSDEGKEYIVREAVTSFVAELEPLMRQKYSEVGKEYWEDVDLGEMVVRPPRAAYENATTQPEPVAYVFEGLGSLLEIDAPVTEYWEVEERQITYKRETTTYQKQQEIPVSVSKRAYRQCLAFLADIGFDVEPEQKRPMNSYN